MFIPFELCCKIGLLLSQTQLVNFCYTSQHCLPILNCCPIKEINTDIDLLNACKEQRLLDVLNYYKDIHRNPVNVNHGLVGAAYSGDMLLLNIMLKKGANNYDIAIRYAKDTRVKNLLHRLRNQKN